jgi:hypothetical protein
MPASKTLALYDIGLTSFAVQLCLSPVGDCRGLLLTWQAGYKPRCVLPNKIGGNATLRVHTAVD